MKYMSEREQHEQEEQINPLLAAQDPFTPSEREPDLPLDNEDDEDLDEQLDYGYTPSEANRSVRGTDRRRNVSSSTSSTFAPGGRKRKLDEVEDDVAESDDSESDWCGPEDGEDGFEPASEADDEDDYT